MNEKNNLQIEIGRVKLVCIGREIHSKLTK